MASRRRQRTIARKVTSSFELHSIPECAAARDVLYPKTANSILRSARSVRSYKVEVISSLIQMNSRLLSTLADSRLLKVTLFTDGDATPTLKRSRIQRGRAKQSARRRTLHIVCCKIMAAAIQAKSKDHHTKDNACIEQNAIALNEVFIVWIMS